MPPQSRPESDNRSEEKKKAKKESIGRKKERGDAHPRRVFEVDVGEGPGCDCAWQLVDDRRAHVVADAAHRWREGERMRQPRGIGGLKREIVQREDVVLVRVVRVGAFLVLLHPRLASHGVLLVRG